MVEEKTIIELVFEFLSSTTEEAILRDSKVEAEIKKKKQKRFNIIEGGKESIK
jgi:hypothetical protein